MAKKQQKLDEDERAHLLFNTVAEKYGGMTMQELTDSCSGLPIRCYAERYVRDSNVYITGKIEMYVGRQGSGKSSYGFHVAGQFLDAGGYFFIVETENKLSPVSLLANLGEERFKSGRVQFIRAGSVDMETEGDDNDSHLQSWQGAVSGILKIVREQNLMNVPIYILVDSILGAAGSESRKEYDEDGKSSGRSTSDMARAASITRFLANLAQDLRDTNILVGFTNHGKDKVQMGQAPKGGDPRSIPGGDSIGFHCTPIMWFERGGKEGDVATVGRNIKLSCFKNSFGDDGRKIDLSFRYDHIRDADGNVVSGVNEEYTRVVRWDWYGATGELLKDFCSKDNFNKYVSCVESRNLITLHDKGSKFECPELDVEGVTAAELGKALEEHPEVERKIRSFPRLGVCQYPVVQYKKG